MANRIPLVSITGQLQTLPSGDVINANDVVIGTSSVEVGSGPSANEYQGPKSLMEFVYALSRSINAPDCFRHRTYGSQEKWNGSAWSADTTNWDACLDSSAINGVVAISTAEYSAGITKKRVVIDIGGTWYRPNCIITTDIWSGQSISFTLLVESSVNNITFATVGTSQSSSNGSLVYVAQADAGQPRYWRLTFTTNVAITTGPLQISKIVGLNNGNYVNLNPLSIGYDQRVTVTKQLVSSLVTGTAPFSIASTTMVSNLNAEFLGGQNGAFYRDASNLNAGTLLSARLSGAYSGITGLGTLTGGLTINNKLTIQDSQPGIILRETDQSGTTNKWIDCEGGTLRLLQTNDAYNTFATHLTISSAGALRAYGSVTCDTTLTVTGLTSAATINATGVNVTGGVNVSGSAGGFGVCRRDTNAFVWQILSTAGELAFYNQVGVAYSLFIQSNNNIVMGATAQIAGQFSSTLATGTAPFNVTSTTLCSNLNVGLLNGQAGSFYQNAGNLNAGTLLAARMPALTGDITTVAGGVATTLVNIGITSAFYGSSTQVPVINFDAKGRATTASNVTITPAVGSLTGLGTGVATLLGGTSSGTGGPSGTVSPTFTGTVSAATINASGLTVSSGISQPLGALGGTAGNTLLGLVQSATTGNADSLRTTLIRNANGSDWQTATWKLGRKIDFTDIGYIAFGPSFDLYGLEFGVTSGMAVRIDNSKRVGIGKTPTVALDVLGAITASSGITGTTGTFSSQVNGSLFVEKYTTFTPTTVGWYRVFTTYVIGGGVLRIIASYNNKWDNLELVWNSNGWGQSGQISIVKGGVYGAYIVSQVRVTGNSGDAAGYLDIYVSDVTSAGPISIYAYGPDCPAFTAPIVVGAVVGTGTTKTLSVARGIGTTDQFYSSVATGTAPLVVASTTLVSNLNVQYLNGQLGSFYQDAGNLNAGTIPSARLANAMKVGGIPGVDLNTLTAAGSYRIQNTEANRPNSLSWGQLLVIQGGADTITQIYGDYAAGALYTRSGNPTNVGGSGSYTAWHTILGSNNYSSYALPLTGGTLSGHLLSGSGYQIKWSDGTLAAPGYSFYGETSTGIARTAAGTLALVVAGVAGARINTAGIGVGVGTPYFPVHAKGSVWAVHATYTGEGGGAIIGASLNGVAEPGLDLRRWTGSGTIHGTTYIFTDSSGQTFFYNGQKSTNTQATVLAMTLSTAGGLTLVGGLTATTISGAGTGLTGTASSLSIGGTAGSISGFNNPTTAATAHTIVYRDHSGNIIGTYGFFVYLNMSHGASGATGDTVFYSSGDDYIRKNNATGFRASLNVPTRTGGDASGTWGISISGTAASATTATNIAGGVAGGVHYQSGVGATAITAAGTSGQVLTSGGASAPTWTTPSAGTVTLVSVSSANGITGSVATNTTTPAITLTLGAITPTSVVASGTVTGSNLSGTNTGDGAGLTGAAGYVARFTSGTALTSSVIRDDGTNVGIGTAAASGKRLSVSGDTALNGQLALGVTEVPGGTGSFQIQKFCVITVGTVAYKVALYN